VASRSASRQINSRQIVVAAGTWRTNPSRARATSSRSCSLVQVVQPVGDRRERRRAGGDGAHRDSQQPDEGGSALHADNGGPGSWITRAGVQVVHRRSPDAVARRPGGGLRTVPGSGMLTSRVRFLKVSGASRTP
jgi:hypothetical protein